MVVRAVVIVSLIAAGCGRIGYDPLGAAGDGGADPGGDGGLDPTCQADVDSPCPHTAQSLILTSNATSSTDTFDRANNRDFSCGTPGTPEQSAQFTVNESGSYNFDTSRSAIGVTLAITEGCAGAELRCVSMTDGQPAILEDLIQGMVITAHVEGASGECGSVTLDVFGAVGIAPADADRPPR